MILGTTFKNMASAIKETYNNLSPKEVLHNLKIGNE